MAADVTYQMSGSHLWIKLARVRNGRPDALQVKLSRLKLSMSSAGQVCEYVSQHLGKKLHEARLQGVQVTEMAYIAAIIRDYYGNQLKSGDGRIITET